MKVKFNKSKDAAQWLVNHPDKRLYVDEYMNYVIWGPHSNVIEYWYFLGDWEDEDGNFYPGDWDFDRLSIENFIDQFDNTELVSD